jgi:glycogen debranching enzyme
VPSSPITGPEEIAMTLPQANATLTDDGADSHSITAGISLQEMRPRVLKGDDTFAVLDHSGDAHAVPGGPEGLYHRDTRHLSRLELTVSGRKPLLLSSAVSDDGAMLTCDLTNPDLPATAGRRAVEKDLVHLRRSTFLRNGVCYERLAVRNHGEQPLRVEVGLQVAADFADLFEVRGEVRARRGTLHPPLVEAAQITLAYTGLDDRRRETRLRFEPAPTRLTPQQAVFDLALAPGQRCRLPPRAVGGQPGPPRGADTLGLRADRR